jgi:hypothetical protein
VRTLSVTNVIWLTLRPVGRSSRRNFERRPATYVLGLLLANLFGVIGANMGRKLFVELQPEAELHFLERCAGGRIRRFEPPATFGATKPPKTRVLHPYHLPPHGHLGRSTPTSTRVVSRDETCRFAIDGSFGRRVLPDCSRKPSPSLGRRTIDKSPGKVNMCKFGWSVGHPT